MKVKVDITAELELIIAEQIKPAIVVGYQGNTLPSTTFIWNLKAGTLTAPVKLANGVYGEKAVRVDRPAGDNEILVAIDLAFAFVEHIRKEGKRQVAPSSGTTTAMTQAEHVNPEPQCTWPNGPCICEGSRYR